MKLFFDIETLSDVDLIEEGLKKYAESPSTHVLMIAYAVDHEPVKVCTNLADFNEFFRIARDADELWAFNTQFDYTVLAKHGFDRVTPINRLRDAHALASYNGYVGNLDTVAKALGLSVLKDDVGSKLMKKIAKEKRLATTPEENEILKKYAAIDVEVLRQIVGRLGRMPEREQKIWETNFKINARGIPLNTKFIKSALKIIEQQKSHMLKQFLEVTNGEVATPQSFVSFKKWLAKRGIVTQSLDKQSVEEILDSNLVTDPTARRALELKRSYGLTSLSKYGTADKQAYNGRIYHCFQYHAASQTGRFSGRGLQPHNLKRNLAMTQDEIGLIINTVTSHDNAADFLSLLGYEPLETLSTVIRSMIHAPSGISTCDFSAIESRLLAHLAGEQWKIDAYARGDDVYVLTYARAFNIDPSKITKTQRLHGKIMELAFGYGGWVDALYGMAKNYGVVFTEEEATGLANAWRHSNQTSVKWLKMLELAVLEAIRTRKAVRIKHGITFNLDNKDLTITLPSGRVMRYPNIDVQFGVDKFGRNREQISYKTITNKSVIRAPLYSGILGNNVVQGIARDLLCDALMECDSQGLEIVGHIHDEILDEKNTHELVAQIMKKPVSWLDGFNPKVSGEHLEHFV
jgi:DNA polymerase